MLDLAKAELNMSKIGLKCKNDQNRAKFGPILRLARYQAKIPNFGPGEGSTA